MYILLGEVSVYFCTFLIEFLGFFFFFIKLHGFVIILTMLYKEVILLCSFSFHLPNSKFQTGGIFNFDEAKLDIFSLMLHDLGSYTGNCSLIQSQNYFLLSVFLENL